MFIDNLKVELERLKKLIVDTCVLRYASFAAAQLLSAINNATSRCIHFALKIDVCKCVRCLGRITSCRRTRSLILLIRLSWPRNVVRWMTDYRRYTPGARCDTWVHRTHAASVHTYHYTGITCCCCCCLVHMLPAGGSPDRHRARSCPSVLDARGRISLFRSVIRDENFSDGPRSARDTFANYDRAARKKTWHFTYPDWWTWNVLFEETRFFLIFWRWKFSHLLMFLPIIRIYFRIICCLLYIFKNFYNWYDFIMN